MKDEYDFCGLKRGSCNYQINADKKIEIYEKALVLACEIISHGDDFEEYDAISIMNNLLEKAGEENGN